MKRRGFWSSCVALAALMVMAVIGRASAGPTTGPQVFSPGGGNPDMNPGKIVGVVVNAAGEPVAEAMVLAMNPMGGFKQTKTGEKGGFAFPELMPGKWLLKGFKMGVGEVKAEAVVESGKVTEVKITLMAKTPPAPGKLVVHVVDGAGAPVAEANVKAFNNMGFKEGMTNEKGTVVFELKPGFYAVLAAKMGVGTGKGEAKVESDKTTEIKVTLQMLPEPGKIVGVVVDGAGEPVAMAGVKLLSPTGPTGQQTMTGEKGLFAFEKVKPGKYVVLAFKMGVGEGKAEVTVESGKVSEVKVVLTAPPPPATGSVKGIVVDAAGAPVGEAFVHVGPPPPGGQSTKTNGDGQFGFEKVKIGKTVVFAEKMGVGKGFAEILVEEGKTTEVKITLKK